ncbi:MAG: hypothetical protein ACW99U_20355, partial [Candidatus Thorarchaeota archaeon]
MFLRGLFIAVNFLIWVVILLPLLVWLIRTFRASRQASQRTLEDDEYDDWLGIEGQTRSSFSLATVMKSSA